MTEPPAEPEARDDAGPDPLAGARLREVPARLRALWRDGRRADAATLALGLGGLLLFALMAAVSTGLAELGYALLVLMTIVQWWSRWRPRRSEFGAIHAAILVWLAAGLLANLVNFQTVGAWRTLDGLRREWLIVGFFGLLTLPRPLGRFRPAVMLGLLLGGGLAALFAWFQVLVGFDPLHAKALGGANVVTRSAGFFSGQNAFAAVVGILGVWSAVMLAYAGQWPRRRRLLAGALTVLVLSAILPSYSRAIVLAVGAVGLILVPLLLPWRWLLPAGALGALAAGLLVSAPQTRVRFAGLAQIEMLPPKGVAIGDDDPLAFRGVAVYTQHEAMRLGLWYFGFQVFQERPTFGWGRPWEIYWARWRELSANWRARAPLTDTERDLFSRPQHAHNAYLQVAIEMGLVGLGAYLLLWAMLLRRFVGTAIQAAARRAPAVLGPAVAGVAVVLLFLLAGAVEYHYPVSSVQSVLWVVLALSLVPASSASVPEASAEASATGSASAATVAGGTSAAAAADAPPASELATADGAADAGGATDTDADESRDGAPAEPSDPCLSDSGPPEAPGAPPPSSAGPPSDNSDNPDR